MAVVVEPLAGAMVKVGAVPVPLRAITTSPLIASSTMVKSPVRAPAAVGLKVIRTLQEALTATLVAQVVVAAKSPVVAMLRMLSGALPEFVKVSDCAALVIPASREPKSEMVPDNVTAGTVGFLLSPLRNK